jgi:hypothetical protein
VHFKGKVVCKNVQIATEGLPGRPTGHLTLPSHVCFCQIAQPGEPAAAKSVDRVALEVNQLEREQDCSASSDLQVVR